MVLALTDLTRSHQLLHEAARLMERAARCLASSRVLISQGETRAVERTRAVMEYDKLHGTPTQGKTASDS
jgi:hypothetical protein